MLETQAMAFIADLAPYDYYRDAPDGMAVGWLDEVQPFRLARSSGASLCWSGPAISKR
jgi:hypothetical protein